VVSQAEKSIADPDVMTVVITGRDSSYASRIREMLYTKPLRMDEVYTNPGTDTELFKRRTIHDLVLTQEPEVVEIWEDRKEHLDRYVEFIRELGVEAIPHYRPAVETVVENHPGLQGYRVAHKHARRI
jgi:hypothetical protein